ncbi:unnamed protein product [Didymodactylos carnosus]|uniref:UNC-45/Cro1/She4 central domain-containing protein n=1 Tax=Didymodactylos carnosus TaxID=1234261 RepID=A0A813Z2Q0_9BILA|nr:unnamed protein product [Didymodactylos carnosus]CAF3676192.1 unnamed protein product [Didymodactylos carnosus]
MTDTLNDKTIAELFDNGYDLQLKLDKDENLDISNDDKQKLFNTAIDTLLAAEKKLDEIHLFSDNEELDEVATNELRYFLLYALIGWLYEYKPPTDRNENKRFDDVKLSIKYSVKYLNLCKNYGLIKSVPNEDIDNIGGSTKELNREELVTRLREKKRLESLIKTLMDLIKTDKTRVDDETKRQLYVSQIKWWIQQLEYDINILKDEGMMLMHRKELSLNQNQTQNKDYSTTSVKNVNNNQTGPFILTTKEHLYAQAVGGKGYPSLPTMTVEEFHDQLIKNGHMKITNDQQQGSAFSMPPSTNKIAEELEKEHLSEIDDTQHRRDINQLDEYKDDNPRGSGNRYNRSNQAFKEGNYKKAIDYYTQAINTFDSRNKENKEDIAKCYSNRSQCYINLSQYEDAVEDATKALEYMPADTKSLFRRANAFERMGKLNEAISDAQRLVSINKNQDNKQTNDLLRKLTETVYSKHSEQNLTLGQVRQMFEAVSGVSSSADQLAALNNLIVLSREESGTEAIVKFDTDLKNIVKFIQSSDRTIVLSTVRLLSSIVKRSYARTDLVLRKIGLNHIARLLATNDQEISTSSAILLYGMITSICDLENRRKIRKGPSVPFNFEPQVVTFIDEVFRILCSLIDDKACPAVGRDNCLDLVVKFVDRMNGCISKLLRVAASVPELPDSKPYPITEHTKMHISCALSVVYHDCYSDKEREDFNNECIEFVKALRQHDDVRARVQTMSVLAVLLQGPFDTGNAILGGLNLVDLMLVMASSGDALQELPFVKQNRVAVEAVVLSSSKKDKAAGILSLGAEILKNLYASPNEQIKVLALVGLSKIASSKGTDTSVQLVTEGSCQTLAKACSQFLTSNKSFDIRRWSADGLAYLTLDADVKEDIINNQAVLKALFELAKCDDSNVIYSVVSILVNLTNTYEVKKPDKQMVELAKYAKQHVPEDHPKDAKEFVDERRNKLVEAGVISVLVNMCKQKSDTCREQVARVFFGLCENEQHRGKIVAAGGGKALLPLALDGLPIGSTKAAQALAKIAITTNPEIAFPGQRTLEVVRPIIKLLKPDQTALENFEALMALTNLAAVGESVRKRILKDGGFSNIEHYMYEEHTELRRAATECVCNMVVQEEVIQYFTPENDRIKLLVLFCGEEDEALIKAASGALAILSSLDVDLEQIETFDLEPDERKKLESIIEDNRIICNKILEVTSFVEIFKQLCVSPNNELQFRALYIIKNIVKAKKEFAVKVAETDLMDLLFAITRLINPQTIVEKNRKIADEIIQLCLSYGLIRLTEGVYDRERVVEEVKDKKEAAV